MSTSSEKTLLYHAQEAIEHVQALPGITPVRLFKVLFPLWEVEVEGKTRQELPLGLIEKYIERGILEGLNTSYDLAEFFQLEVRLVGKVLALLIALGHVHVVNSNLYLTPIGQASLKRGMKVTEKETHRRLYFEAFSLLPLEKQYYERRVTNSILSELQAETSKSIQAFRPLFASRLWNNQAVAELGQRLDRDKFNVPDEVKNLTVRGQIRVYLPMYVIETHRKNSSSSLYYTVYTRIAGHRDPFFEGLVNKHLGLIAQLRSDEPREEEEIWQEWITKHHLLNARLEQQKNGRWRVIVPPNHFRSGTMSKPSISDIGMYDFDKGYFLHIWCEDEALRRQAALERTLKKIKGRTKNLTLHEVQENLQRFTIQLQTGVLTVADLREQSERAGMKEIVSWLQEQVGI